MSHPKRCLMPILQRNLWLLPVVGAACVIGFPILMTYLLIRYAHDEGLFAEVWGEVMALFGTWE